MSEPIHIQPTARSSPNASCCQAIRAARWRLAQWLLEAPLMFNHNRGLWGYTGRAG